MKNFSSKKSKIIFILLVIIVGIAIYFITREEKDYDEIARQNRDEVVAYLKEYIESLNGEGVVIDTDSGYEVKDRKLIEEMITILKESDQIHNRNYPGGLMIINIIIGERNLMIGETTVFTKFNNPDEILFYDKEENWSEWIDKVIEKAEQNKN